MTAAALQTRLHDLRTRLKTLQPGLIAVSGGVDSRLLLRLARIWDLEFQSAHALGPHQSLMEQRHNLALVRAEDPALHLLRFDPLTLPRVQTNSRQRCYWCKRALLGYLLETATANALHRVLDGTQHDDLAAHRPGHRALEELGIHSPLAWAGMTKQDVRTAARQFGLAEPDQPSRACLLTRFPYDRRVTAADLEAVGRVEDALAGLGLRRFRFRVTGGEMNLLQVHPEEGRLMRSRITELRHCIEQAGLGPFQLQTTANLSGFFDIPANAPADP